MVTFYLFKFKLATRMCFVLFCVLTDPFRWLLGLYFT